MTDSPMTPDERDFARNVLRFYRVAGKAEASKLTARMKAAVDDGADQADLARMVRDALATLPLRH